MSHLQRTGLLDGRHALERPLHESVVDALLNQRAAGTGADFALVEREHHKALDRLVEEVVVLLQHVGEEDVGRFAAQLQRDRNQVLAGVLHDEPAGGGFAGKGDLGHARAGGQRLARLKAVAVHDVQHARRQQVAHQLGPHQNARRGLLGRLQHHAVARGQRRRQLPGGHQNGEVPRNDLPDHAQRLCEMVGHRVAVDLGERAFLGANAAGEVAPVIDGQGNDRPPWSRGWACRCPRSRPAPAGRGCLPCAGQSG